MAELAEFKSLAQVCLIGISDINILISQRFGFTAWTNNINILNFQVPTLS